MLNSFYYSFLGIYQEISFNSYKHLLYVHQYIKGHSQKTAVVLVRVQWTVTILNISSEGFSKFKSEGRLKVT